MNAQYGWRDVVGKMHYYLTVLCNRKGWQPSLLRNASDRQNRTDFSLIKLRKTSKR